jgi:hypothetical protein
LDTDSATLDSSCDLIILLDKTGGGGTIREYGGGFLQSTTRAACSGRIISVPPDAVRLFVVCHLSFVVFRYLSFVRKCFAVLARVADRPKRGWPQEARV